MLFIDSALLRRTADRLAELRESAIPSGPPAPPATGFAALTSACSDFCAAMSAARLAQAGCLDRLGNGLRTAANRWEDADALPLAR